MDRLNEMYAAVADLILWEECTAPALVVGTKVRVKCVDWRGTSIKYATIQKVNEDETFDSVFDDGWRGTRKNVPLNEIQIQNVSHSFILVCVVRFVCFAHTYSSSFFLYLFFFYYYK
jgi:hypothetical protein